MSSGKLWLLGLVFTLQATASSALLKALPPTKKMTGPNLRLFELAKRDSRPVRGKEQFLPERVYLAKLPGVKHAVVILTDSLGRLAKPFEVLQPGTILPSRYLGTPDKGNYLLTPKFKWVPTSRKEVYYQAVLSVPPQSRSVGFRAAVEQPEQVVFPTILERAKTAPELAALPNSTGVCWVYAYETKSWEACAPPLPASRVVYYQSKFMLTDGYGTLRPTESAIRKGSCLSGRYFGGTAEDHAFLRNDGKWVWLDCWEKAEFEIASHPPKIEAWIVEKLDKPLASLD